MIEKCRRKIIPKLGIIVQLVNELFGLNLYVKGESRNKEFVGRVKMDEAEFEKFLFQKDFERNPLASLKKISTGEIEEGSFRRIYPDRYPRKQLHVIFYDGKKLPNADTGEIYIYAHWEYRWDTDPIKHYKGVDIDRKKGVVKMRNYLRMEKLNFDYIQP